MKNTLKIALFISTILLFACDDTTAPTGNDQSAETSHDTSTQRQPGITEEEGKIQKQDLKDCPVSGKAREINVFRMDDIAQMIAISADESTYDAALGDSDRILEVFNTTDCSSLLKTTLPINRSADFPYYLAPRCYESTNKIVGIQGFTNFYYYDAENQKLSKSLEPSYVTEREAVDAQSGMIKGLMVWEHYIMGQAVDFGPFAFDISDKANPKPVMAVAEFNIPNTEEFRYMFLLEAGNERYQAIYPVTDADAGGNMFEVQKLFPQPLKVETTVPKNARDNRYIILRDYSDPGKEKRVAIDMLKHINVPLPDDIASKKNAEILDWLKARQ